MNLDDLRRELQDRASEPGGTSMPDRLAGVQSKVVAARRRKAVASGVAAIASLAVVGLVSTQLVNLGRDDLHDSDLAHMPKTLNGDKLVEASYNDGASELSWNVALESLDVLTRATCVLPDGVVPPDSTESLQLAWKIVTPDGPPGQGQYSVACGSEDDPGVGTNGPGDRADWRELGVKPGDEIQIDVWLLQGGVEVEVPGAQFGVALYKRSGDREQANDVELTRVLDVGDDSFEFADWKTRPLSEGKRILRLQTEVSDGPIAIVYGWQSETPTAAYELKLDGEVKATGYGGRIEDPFVVDGDTVHKLALRARGSTADGVLVLAYYTLKDK